MRCAFAHPLDTRCASTSFEHGDILLPNGSKIRNIVQVACARLMAMGLPSLGYGFGIVFALHLCTQTTAVVAMAARKVRSQLRARAPMFATGMWMALFVTAQQPHRARFRTRTKPSCTRSQQHHRRHAKHHRARKHMRTTQYGRGMVVLDQIADMEDRSRHGSPRRNEVMVSHFLK